MSRRVKKTAQFTAVSVSGGDNPTANDISNISKAAEEAKNEVLKNNAEKPKSVSKSVQTPLNIKFDKNSLIDEYTLIAKKYLGLKECEDLTLERMLKGIINLSNENSELKKIILKMKLQIENGGRVFSSRQNSPSWN